MIERIVFELIMFHASDIKETRIFRSLKHNSDLCPKYAGKLAFILEAFQKYQTLVSDIQGPWDRGTDIVIKFPSEGNSTKHICIQIKSEGDLKDSSYLKELKSQYSDSQRTYDEILDYYIFLCCDAEANTEKIRSIGGYFSKDKNVHVIQPEYALTFYRLGAIQIEALIKAYMGSDDKVFNKSWQVVADLTPTEIALILFMVWASLFEDRNEVSFESIYNSAFVRLVYAGTLDYGRSWFFTDEAETDEDDDEEDYAPENHFELRGLELGERISIDLDCLEAILINQTESGCYTVEQQSVLPLMALMLDGHIRYDHNDVDLLKYMLGLFAPLKGCDIFLEQV